MNSRLFIIGNGFDKAHSLPTGYIDFKEYLINKYPDADANNCTFSPEPDFLPDGGEHYNDTEVISFLLKIIENAEPNGDGWAKLEESMGNLNLSWFLYDFNKPYDNEWHEVYRNQDLSLNLAGAVLLLPYYFDVWIQSIDISQVIPLQKFYNLINPVSDLFFTFNYTNTLQSIYVAKNVLHIHGKQGEQLIFGHGNNSDIFDYYQNNYIGSENNINRMHLSLRKDTNAQISKHINYFEALPKTIREIYSFGFSFSEVDMIYIKEICENLTTENMTWYLHSYNSKEERSSFSKAIQSCGYMGRFSEYEI